MRLLIARHGKALAGAEDAKRPLSDAGREGVEAVARFLGHSGTHVDRVFHSGRIRALETAQILGPAVAPGHVLEHHDGIDLSSSPAAFAKEIMIWREDALIASHQPFVSALLSILLTKSSSREVVTFKKGAVACVQRRNENWVMEWMITPKLVQGISV